MPFLVMPGVQTSRRSESPQEIAMQQAEHVVFGLGAEPDDRTILQSFRHPWVLVSAQRLAHSAWQAARRAVFNPPTADLDEVWQDACQRARRIVAMVPAGTNPGSEADQRAMVAQVQIWIAARLFFAKAATLPDRAAIVALCEQERARREAAKPRYAAPVSPLAHKAGEWWNPAPFITKLAQKGIVLGLDAQGAILARPAGAMAQTDRDVLLARRAEVVAFLSAETETIAA